MIFNPKPQHVTLVQSQFVTFQITKFRVNSPYLFINKQLIGKSMNFKRQLICHSSKQITFKNSKSFISIFYITIIVYKQTLRAKIKQYFDPITMNYFFLASLPFIGYLGHIGFKNYNNSYARSLLFQNTLPVLKTPTHQISWETLNNIKDYGLFDLDKIEAVYYGDNASFIITNPHWLNFQTNSYVGTFKPLLKYNSDLNLLEDYDLKVPSEVVISSAYSPLNFSYLFGRDFTRHSNSNFLKSPHHIIWNSFFNNLDEIPSKLSGLYNQITIKNLQENQAVEVTSNYDYIGLATTAERVFEPINDTGWSFQNSISFTNSFENPLAQNYLIGHSRNSEQPLFEEKELSYLDNSKLTFNKNFQKYRLSKTRLIDYNIWSSLGKLTDQLKLLLHHSPNFNLLPSWATLNSSNTWKLALLEDPQKISKFTDLFFEELDEYLNVPISIELSKQENKFEKRDVPKPKSKYELKVNSLMQKILTLSINTSSTNFVTRELELKEFVHLDKTISSKLLNSRVGFSETKQTQSFSKIIGKLEQAAIKSKLNNNFLTKLQTNLTVQLNKLKSDKTQNYLESNLNLSMKRQLSGYLYPDSFQNLLALRDFSLKIENRNSSILWNPKTIQLNYCPKSSFSFDLKMNPRINSESVNLITLNSTLREPFETFTSKKQLFTQHPTKHIFGKKANFYEKSRSNNPFSLLEKSFFKRRGIFAWFLQFQFIEKIFISKADSLWFKALGKIENRLTVKDLWDINLDNYERNIYEIKKILPSKLNLTNLVLDSSSLLSQTKSLNSINTLGIQKENLVDSIVTYKNYSKSAQSIGNLFSDNNHLKNSWVDLHEGLTLKSWTLLSQVGFIYLIYRFFEIVQNEYRVELINYIKTYSIYVPLSMQKYLQSSIIDDQYRIIRNSSYRFKTFIGSQYILPKFAQVIFYLINARHLSSRLLVSKPIYEKAQLNSAMGESLPKAFLLVGPPGTGKTLLIKALAGETSVPVIIESGKMFKSNLFNDKGNDLEQLFAAAKSISPSLLFLDEIDKIGKRRKHMTMQGVNTIEQQINMPNSLDFIYQTSLPINFLPSNSLDTATYLNPIVKPIEAQIAENINSAIVDENSFITSLNVSFETQNASIQKKLTGEIGLLTQLLNLVDGINIGNNVIVIGATNRPTVLDPALTRPGRFSKVIYLDLPGKARRFNLLKFYSNGRAINSINWEYFSKQTHGLSAAHISAAMNRSLLKGIYETHFKDYWSKNKSRNQLESLFSKDNQKVQHTFDSIEYGIQTVSTKTVQIQLNTAIKFNQKLLGNYYLKKNNFSQLCPKIFSESLFYSRFKQNESFFLNKNLNQFTNLKKKSENKKTIFSEKFATQVQIKNINKIKRQEFFLLNKKKLRTLALLNQFEKTQSLLRSPISSSLKDNLTKLKNFIDRLIQNQAFGWHVLLNSTCLIKNPFFKQTLLNYLSQTQFGSGLLIPKQYELSKDKLVQINENKTDSTKIFYNFIQLDQFYLKEQFSSSLNLLYWNILNLNFDNERGTTCFKSNNHSLVSQEFLLGEALMLRRGAYYISGQCLMSAASGKMPVQSLNLWSLLLGNDQITQLNLSNLSNTLFTKIDFELYLLFLISGKVAEILMLSSNNSKNYSTIGRDELKLVGSLFKIMIEKYLYYSPKLFSKEQLNINLLNNEIQTPIERDYFFLQGFTKTMEIQSHQSTKSLIKGVYRYDQLSSIDRPWWQFQSLYQISSGNIKYGTWYRFFLTEGNQNFRNIEWIPPEKYYHNQVNNSFGSFDGISERGLIKEQDFDTKFILEHQKWGISQANILFFYELNKLNVLFELFNKLFPYLIISQKSTWNNLNWNGIQLLPFNDQSQHLIFELFNCPFELFENNRELLDSLVYLLLSHGKIREFEIEKYYNRHFLKSSF